MTTKVPIKLAVIDPSDTGERRRLGYDEAASSVTEYLVRGAWDDSGVLRPIHTQSLMITFERPVAGDDTDALKKVAAETGGALVVVPSDLGSHEAAMSKNGGYARTALETLFATGIRQVIVACSEMHRTGPPYSEARFEEIKKELDRLLAKIGYGDAETQVIPVDLRGDNIHDRSSNTPWYRDATLDEALSNLKP
ncbi:hypothetical protein ACWD4F_30850 [Streptomyces aureus]